MLFRTFVRMVTVLTMLTMKTVRQTESKVSTIRQLRNRTTAAWRCSLAILGRQVRGSER